MAAFAAGVDEILVEQAKPMRANPGPAEHAWVTQFNDLCSWLAQRPTDGRAAATSSEARRPPYFPKVSTGIAEGRPRPLRTPGRQGKGTI